jgi:hypothetical protein
MEKNYILNLLRFNNTVFTFKDISLIWDETEPILDIFFCSDLCFSAMLGWEIGTMTHVLLSLTKRKFFYFKHELFVDWN